jgi:hypothetical protein
MPMILISAKNDDNLCKKISIIMSVTNLVSYKYFNEKYSETYSSVFPYLAEEIFLELN